MARGLVPLLLATLVAGCARWPGPAGPPKVLAPSLPNPAPVGSLPAGSLWQQVEDVVDDYFPIASRQPLRVTEGVVTEGRIDTWPVVGATIFEPHRPDSVGRYQRLESTLQTVRRRATVRVLPGEGGYFVDVVVEKELEEVSRPEHSSAGAATLRSDASLVRLRDRAGLESETLGWISQGRDVALEQQILAEIYSRLGAPPPVAVGGP